MEYNINIWLLCAVIPAIMATYLLPGNQEAPKPDDIVRVLVEQVRDLQNVVTEQGHRIDALEKRLAAKQRADKSGYIGKGASVPNDLGNKEEPWFANYQKTIDSKDDGNPLTLMKDQVNSPTESNNKGKMRRGIRASANVAFSAYLDHSLANLGLGQTVKFNQVLLNDGNHYNTHSGIFTVPINGVYLLTFHIADIVRRAAVQLMVDDVHKAEALVEPSNVNNVMGGNTVLLRLIAGQSVWLQTYAWDDAGLFANSADHVVTFSGYMVY